MYSQHPRALCAYECPHRHVDVGGSPLAAVEAALVGRITMLQIPKEAGREDDVEKKCENPDQHTHTNIWRRVIGLTTLPLKIQSNLANSIVAWEIFFPSNQKIRTLLRKQPLC